MSSNEIKRQDPVATREFLESLKGEALIAWRTAPLPNRASAAERSIDLPMPYGWFAMCYSDELAVGQVKPLHYFGRDLVAWRGEDGEARVLDAYCAHLGAHMGYGGRVRGNHLECPFHSWRYNGEGQVPEIPYSKVVPPQAKRGCVKGYPTAEANRFVWAWYHPEGVAPLWEVEPFPETTDAEWTDYERHEWNVYCPLQTIAENGVDVAHFLYIHGTSNYPDWEVTMKGHCRSAKVNAKLDTPRGQVDGTISYGVVGPGQPWTRFTGICETLLVTGATPVDKDHVHLRFAFTQKKSNASGPQAGVAKALIADICRQLDQDKVVWDRQRHMEKPLLCEGDGPIMAFRDFYKQFYPGNELHTDVERTMARKRG